MAAVSIADKVKANCPSIREQIKRCESQPQGVVQSTIADVLAQLIREDLAYIADVDPKNVVVHPCNRQETGWDGPHCHELLDGIGNNGFSRLNMENPIVFEKRKGDEGEKEVQSVLNNIQKANGLLPDIVP